MFSEKQTGSAIHRLHRDPELKGTYLSTQKNPRNLVEDDNLFSHLVVEACAMIFPPIGFLGSAANIAAPSTCATTWLVITTATPNYKEKSNNSESIHLPQPEWGKKKKKKSFLLSPLLFITTLPHISKQNGSRQRAGRKPSAEDC